MTIRVATVGGGPGGLFFSTLLKRARPDIDVVLFERNQPTDAFGFGVVFSDRTLQQIDDADPVLRDALARDGVHWDAIAVSSHDETHTFAGNGMAAIHRKVLLRLLQQAALEAGVDARFGHDVPGLDALADFDVVVAADGTNSRIREGLGDSLGSSVETASAKFIWFGTPHRFDSLTFVHRNSEHGNFAAHAYPISGGLSTFIVETDEETWRVAGLDAFDPATPPGPTDTSSQRYLEQLFDVDIAGEGLVGNNSRWANFRTRRTSRWHAGNVVLLGDAVHTAHFSVGSGTKMAMEDAIVLARELAASDDIEAAFARYEEARRPAVARIQDAARPSLSWWEHFGFYHRSMDPLSFAFHFFSRSIDIERIRRRDPGLADDVERAWRERHRGEPMDTPLEFAGVRLGGRDLRVVRDGEIEWLTDRIGGRAELSRVARRLAAPAEEAAVARTEIPDGEELLVIGGGNSLTRALLSERARLAHGRATAVVEDVDEPAARTLVLSGRADAVIREIRR
ncbi:FAD-dependent monooxygenase [Microbacterium sp. NPDC055683]